MSRNIKGGSRGSTDNVSYGAPMRKWDNGQPVGASANANGTTTTGGMKRRRTRRTRRNMRRSRTRRSSAGKKRKTYKKRR
jgi:hypothetical protein